MLKLSPAYAARFNDLMERITSGTPSQQALEATYGRSVDAVSNDLRDWFLKGRSAPVAPTPTSDQLSMDLSEVPSSTVRALLTAIRSTADVPDQVEVRIPTVFPASIPGVVVASYQPVSVAGDQYGTLLGNFAWDITGPSCIYLLTPNIQVVRTYN